MTVREMIARLQEMPQDSEVTTRGSEYQYRRVNWLSSEMSYENPEEGALWTSEHDGLVPTPVVVLG